MKTTLFKNGAIAALAVLAVLISACKKDAPQSGNDPQNKPASQSENGKTPEPGDEAPAEEKVPEVTPTVVPDPAPDSTPEPEPAPTPEPKTDPAPEAAAAGGPVSKQVQGYWVMDKDSMIEAMKAEAAKEAGENLDQAAIALILPMFEMMAEMVVIKIGDGTMSQLSPEGEENSTFKFLETDDANGKFKIIETKENGEEEKEVPGHIKGDTLTITDDGTSYVMNRIDEEEFNKRQKKIKDLDPTKLLQGLIPEGLEEELSKGLQIEEAPEPTPVPEP